jgi:hypothetical protein
MLRLWRDRLSTQRDAALEISTSDTCWVSRMMQPKVYDYIRNVSDEKYRNCLLIIQAAIAARISKKYEAGQAVGRRYIRPHSRSCARLLVKMCRHRIRCCVLTLR